MEKYLTMLRGLIKYRNLLFELVTRDIKIRYRRSFLGLLWTLLNPILMMLIMTIVFSNFFRFDINNFPVYFFTGSILFSFVTESTTNALTSIVGNASLIKKVYVPKYLFPMSNVLSSIVNLFFSVIAMMIVMLITNVSFHLTMLLTPLLLVYVCLFSLGLGLILATFQVFFRDIAHIYGVVTMAWMYLTPVFYPESLLSEKYKLVLDLNPMVHYIRFMREIILNGSIPSVGENLICLGISSILLFLGMMSFYRKQDKFILYI